MRVPVARRRRRRIIIGALVAAAIAIGIVALSFDETSPTQSAAAAVGKVGELDGEYLGTEERNGFMRQPKVDERREVIRQAITITEAPSGTLRLRWAAKKPSAADCEYLARREGLRAMFYKIECANPGLWTDRRISGTIEFVLQRDGKHAFVAKFEQHFVGTTSGPDGKSIPADIRYESRLAASRASSTGSGGP